MRIDLAIRNWQDYQRVYKYSLDHNSEFWDAIARDKLKWKKDWTQVSDCDFNTARVNWFLGGELNVSENCLDRHIEEGGGDRRALIWVGNDLEQERVFTFRELHREVCKVAHALEAMGVRKGDCVAIYLPNIPELAISMLACARIGAIHCVIFGGFSAHSIQSRVNDCGAVLILTANGTFRGPKWVDLKSNVDEAMSFGCPTVKKVIVFDRHPERSYVKKAHDLAWKDWVHSGLPEIHVAPSLSAQDPLFILYTSGSTGKPKGVLHRMGGYLTYAAYTYEIVFQPSIKDVYWCTADLGWITAHSYMIYGPLTNGITTLMFEGIPTHPDPSRFWQIVERYEVSIFYTAPTAIRILAGAGDHFVKKYSRKSIRTLGSVGEPISPEAWKWFHQVVGESQAPIVDTWWQTETGGVLIAPLAGISPTKPGSASFPLPGIEPKLLDDQGRELLGKSKGSLVLARSWPGQMTEVYGDPSRFHETYFTQFQGFYSTGDGACRDEEGFYWITGRTDDVIKVSGHRLGTAEIESACMTHPSVTESAAVGVPDAITGEALTLFVVLNEGVVPSATLMSEVSAAVRRNVGPLATPRKVHWVPGLPKTRSGKIMRRLLKKMALGETENLGDTSTLADPAVVEKMIDILQGARVGVM